MIRVALVGCGYWGTNLCRVLQESPRFELGWICDGHEAARNRGRALAPQARPCATVAEVLADDDADAVVVATPVQTHFAVAREALAARKHVLVEKPLAANSEEATALCLLAIEQRVVLMAGHTFLYNNAVREVKKMINSGELGELRYIFCQRLNLGIVRSDVDALWNLAPHDLSILNYWISRPVESVAAVGHAFLRPGIADLVFGHLRFEGNVSGHLHVSWLDPSKVRRATVVGTRRMMVYDDTSEVAPLTVFDKGVDISVADAGPEAFPTYAQHNITVRTGETWIHPVTWTEPLAAEVDEFASSICDGRDPITGGADGLAVVQLLERLSRSMTGVQSR